MAPAVRIRVSDDDDARRRADAEASAPGGVVGPGTADDADRSIPPAPARRRRWLVLALGLVFLFAPAAAFVSGVRATEIENRRLAAFPSVADGWEFFPRLTVWATDHLPLRDRAVEANTELSEGVFGEAPQYGGSAPAGGAGPVAPAPAASAGPRTYAKILQGEDDWLFFGADVQNACEPEVELDTTLAGLSRFGDLLERAGKRYVFVVAPDKSTMNPDRLPDSYVGDDCAPEAKQAFWERLQSSPPTGYVDLEDPLEQLQQDEGDRLWRPSDTHWAPRGALVFAEQLARALDPQLWRTSALRRTGPVELRGDLAAQLGTPRTDEVPGWQLERAGVTVTSETETRLASTTTGAPLWTGPTLVLGDSFTQSSKTALAPLFAGAQIVHPETAVADAAAVVQAVRGADTVVLEIVERSVAGGDVPIIDPTFTALLEQALAPAGGAPASPAPAGAPSTSPEPAR